MIFKTMGATVWRFFDAICFAFACIFADIAAYHAGPVWFYLALAATAALAGYASELLAGQPRK